MDPFDKSQIYDRIGEYCAGDAKGYIKAYDMWYESNKKIDSEMGEEERRLSDAGDEENLEKHLEQKKKRKIQNLEAIIEETRQRQKNKFHSVIYHNSKIPSDISMIIADYSCGKLMQHNLAARHLA